MDDGLSVCIGQGVPREAFEVEDHGLVLWLFVRANVGNMGGCVYLLSASSHIWPGVSARVGPGRNRNMI